MSVQFFVLEGAVVKGLQAQYGVSNELLRVEDYHPNRDVRESAFKNATTAVRGCEILIVHREYALREITNCCTRQFNGFYRLPSGSVDDDGGVVIVKSFPRCPFICVSIQEVRLVATRP